MSDVKPLEAIMERAASWPEEAQAELVRSMMNIETKYFGVYRLSEEERAAVREGMEDIRLGRLATDAEVAAVFERYRQR